MARGHQINACQSFSLRNQPFLPRRESATRT